MDTASSGGVCSGLMDTGISGGMVGFNGYRNFWGCGQGAIGYRNFMGCTEVNGYMGFGGFVHLRGQYVQGHALFLDYRGHLRGRGKIQYYMGLNRHR